MKLSHAGTNLHTKVHIPEVKEIARKQKQEMLCLSFVDAWVAAVYLYNVKMRPEFATHH
jgi:hypothetical protein